MEGKSKPTEKLDPQLEFRPPPTTGRRDSRWGLQGKTVWDWLQLLIVPMVLSLITVGFAWQQNDQQQEIEERRAKSDRELEAQRAQEAALQAYLDQMGQLLLNKDVRNLEEGSELRLLARARTLTVLQRLDDPSRKVDVLRFLLEAELAQGVDGNPPVIGLQEADLHGVGFANAPLNDANLYAADLSDANLFGAKLSGADLREAILSNANLIGADLSGADLVGTNLSGADLREANLNNVLLLGADLSEANLSDASGVTRVQLKQQAASLEGATMPGTTVIPRQGEIAAGEYASDEFEPALSFEIGKGWEVPTPETTEQMIIQTVSEGGQLIFTSPHQVFAPKDPGERKKVPAPENVADWISWFQNHPNLNISKPVSIDNVGGATGVQTDVTPTSTSTDCDGHPCVPLFPTGQEGTDIRIYGAGIGKDRFIIVDLGGETVVIDIYAEEEDFDEFLPKAMNVLNTIEWKGS